MQKCESSSLSIRNVTTQAPFQVSRAVRDGRKYKMLPDNGQRSKRYRDDNVYIP